MWCGSRSVGVFKQASSASRAAAQLQREIAEQAWPHAIRPRVRIGLHAGEVLRRGSDYSGIAVNRAARLRAVAHGGQAVASRVLVELIAGELGGGLHWANLGLHRVRDFPGWTDIFQLCAPSLPRDFPALATLDTGLPPVTTIVFLDADGLLRTVTKISHEDENALEFAFGAPYGRSLRVAGTFIRHATRGKLTLTPSAAAVIDVAEDLVVRDPQA
jgi:hypothetical protein